MPEPIRIQPIPSPVLPLLHQIPVPYNCLPQCALALRLDEFSRLAERGECCKGVLSGDEVGDVSENVEGY
jgi:hypothetical protein